MSGWIKTWRTLAKWEWYSSPNCTQVFLDLLIHANYENGTYRGVFIPKGSLTTSREKIAKRTGLTVQEVRTVLSKLQIGREVTIKTTKKYTMISITNWETYQGDNSQINQQITQESTSPSTNKATTSKKERNKEDKKDLKPEFLVIDYYNQTNDRSLKQVDSNYKEIRARIKEGHTVEDMKQLIDYAAKVWSKDAFWVDKNRPSTLFNGKFDGYLQTAKDAFKPKIDPLMALAQKYLNEDALADSKEDLK